MSPVIERIRHGLLVSCQAAPGDPFCNSISAARFGQAALAGGAVGLRVNGKEDIHAVRATTDVPIIGIQKAPGPDGATLITKDFESARALVKAGADLVALDATKRGKSFGTHDLIGRIKRELGVPVLADIATLDEALAAQAAGADAVLTTLRGYTADTAHIAGFEPDFVRAIVAQVDVPVIAEGRVNSPEAAAQAIDAGAFAVIVGSAITRPRWITERFVSAVTQRGRFQDDSTCVIGLDLGGTRTKIGAVDGKGKMLFSEHVPTPADQGREHLLAHLVRAAEHAVTHVSRIGLRARAVGIATAGWVDIERGVITYATDNLPGWTGAPVAEVVGAAVGLPIVVENDANAFALGEQRFGLGRGLNDFICITLGTGVGGGCVIGGRLNRGAHRFGNAIGLMSLVPGGQAYATASDGCLEAYCNASALVRYAGGAFGDAEQVVAAARRGHADAQQAVDVLARHLAVGCASLINLLDPEAIIISGGLAQDNPGLFDSLIARLSMSVPAWDQRGLKILPSTLGYYGGVSGAVAAVLDQESTRARAALQI